MARSQPSRPYELGHIRDQRLCVDTGGDMDLEGISYNLLQALWTIG